MVEGKIPKDAFDGIPSVFVQKGVNERLSIQPWVRSGHAFLSLGVMDRKVDGTYAFLRRKGFALGVKEAKELVLKLATQISLVEEQMERIDTEQRREHNDTDVGSPTYR